MERAASIQCSWHRVCIFPTWTVAYLLEGCRRPLLPTLLKTFSPVYFQRLLVKMSFSHNQTVTIDREYFETLLRRVTSNDDAFSSNGTAVPTVAVSKTELDELRTIGRKYENLKRNLLRGGVEDDTVELLSQDDSTNEAAGTHNTSPSKTNATEDDGARLYPLAQQPSIQHSARHKPSYSKSKASGRPGYDSNYSHIKNQSQYQSQSHSHSHSHSRSQYHSNSPWAEEDEERDEDDEGEYDDGSDGGQAAVPGANYTQHQGQSQHFERACDRTVHLHNLAEGTTHADITSAVRGGFLLEVFLRSHERTASVSFLNSADARKFLERVRRHDLYIKNKRVDAKWAERQFVLPGHVAGKISMGACRNLVIFGYDGRHTEEVIRDDLDHIHNLVVVKVQFIGGNAYIELNSVHNAIYARPCMISRARYKGIHVQFGVDECAQPYPEQPTPKARDAYQPKKPVAAVTNRFQLLNVDDEEEDEISATFQSKKSMVAA
ncbi:hypothetical protein QBC44DRAFT_325782 [Cladorrhinum sp. PSN332]|nr:hypothetical protein QBC44DRAFT_325782 [Cladorrhinum sp. PSN332]